MDHRNEGLIEHDDLVELICYDPASGLFTWRHNRGVVRSGDVAGTPNGNGYTRIVIRKKKYFAHRLAWFYMNKSWPDIDIDHINGVRNDNRIENLRLLTRSANLQNRGPNSGSSTGLIGSSFDRSKGKYLAQICVGKKNIKLGRFDTAEEAHEAYLAAKRIHHKEIYSLGGRYGV